MSHCIIRKAAYRANGGKNLTWAMVLSTNHGLSLLFVKRQNDKQMHQLVLAVEGADGVFEDTRASRYPLPHSQMENLGNVILALGEEIEKEAFRRIFEEDNDDKWKNE